MRYIIYFQFKYHLRKELISPYGPRVMGSHNILTCENFHDSSQAIGFTENCPVNCSPFLCSHCNLRQAVPELIYVKVLYMKLIYTMKSLNEDRIESSILSCTTLI